MVNQQNLNNKSTLNIDEIYLNQAYNIRMDFENINVLVDNKQKDIKKLKENIISLKNELIKVQKDIKKNKDKTDTTGINSVYDILDNLELESQKLANVIKPIQVKMEDLRKSEIVLYETLKEKYPKTEREDLLDVIRNYIIKKKGDQ